MTVKQLESLPRPVLILRSIMTRVNAFFDFLYHSKYNPFYQSGTLTIGLLLILIITGVYLIIFYRVGSPYESVETIQHNVWLGDIIRSIHRYATDAVLITLAFHVLQLIIQGKTWGPRTLAWISGIILLVIVFISTWTGYVMVWDRQGQLLAQAGASMIQLVPFLEEPLARAFDGNSNILASFFFMNLFLHVALPLGIIAGVWLHTSRLNRAAWLPKKAIIYTTLLAIVLTAIILPANLQPKADLLQLPDAIEIDFFYNSWLLLSAISPWYSLALLLFLLFFGLSFPLWCKPKSSETSEDSNTFAASYVDKEECLGCSQCSRDCPFEAITMKKREGKIPLYSHVDPALCVSCGTCSASCDDFAIGPVGRTGKDQLGHVANYFNRPDTDHAKAVALLVCQCNHEAAELAKDYATKHFHVDAFAIGCCGNLHSYAIEELLTKCQGVAIWGCPERNCYNRLGVTLLKERIYDLRHPTLKRRTDRNRVKVFSLASSEKQEFLEEFTDFTEQLNSEEPDKTKNNQSLIRKTWGLAKMTAVSLLIMSVIAYFSVFTIGTAPNKGVVRFIAKVPGESDKSCRTLSKAEMEKLPFHMRKPELCEHVALSYLLVVSIDGKEIDNQEILHTGIRNDQPYYINRDYPLAEGKHNVKITLSPMEESLVDAYGVLIDREVEVVNGRIVLVTYNSKS